MKQDAFHAVRTAYLMDETACLHSLLPKARRSAAQREQVAGRAAELVRATRQRLRENRGLATLLQEYDLSSAEGVLLMCLAESLLRIPDSYTADRLIQDKLAQGEWARHLDDSRAVTVNAATWGLMLTGRWLQWEQEWERNPVIGLRRLAARLGDAAMRSALRRAMAVLARQFVMGEDIAGARKASVSAPGLRYSFDCLGEAARTAADAQRYFDAYADAIRQLADAGDFRDPLSAPGISVKLSALHPRYEFAQRQRVFNELLPRLRELVSMARDAGINLTVDAEEADRLELSLEVFAAILRQTDLDGWQGLGLAVQAYQKRALPVLEWLVMLARETDRRIPVRLVKGAYWDMEIKRTQERGLTGYPVFTRKAATDVSYQACAGFMLAHREALYPQFATHNAYTIAWVLAQAGETRDFEFQRLHGMGEALYESLLEQVDNEVNCRIYAPIGPYRELLPYLVRRLLENGANSSFVNQIGHEDVPVERLVEDPVARIEAVDARPHPRIPLPRDLYGEQRRNSHGIEFSDVLQWRPLQERIQATMAGFPLTITGDRSGEEYLVTSPADRDARVGVIIEADASAVSAALDAAHASRGEWNATPAEVRAACLERVADGLEARCGEFMALVVREGGRCLPDALSEVREAADFCRYYAFQARRGFAEAAGLPGPTGEGNSLRLHGRGVFLCISPWNFPLAIFTGQVAAALAAGNPVLAKPARQTPLVAARVVRLMHEAGIPRDVLHLLPGPGSGIGNLLLGDERIAGVAFTGSTATARHINQQLAKRPGPIVPLIAETGGQNVMIVDSSALPEQVVADVIGSAFTSAGQRCSALRVLYLQEEIAGTVLEMLAGAMDELVIGDPMELATDVGPVIDAAARDKLQAHADWLEAHARRIKVLTLPAGTDKGSFFVPRVYEIDRLDQLAEEVFGPILHVIRYPARALDEVIDAINATGYGLTLGVHSRIEAHWERVRARARVGNLYINRNMIGAVVGVQPFGGEGLSGTGPKAGGPHYLYRFATERSVSINTAAIGGNAGLLGLESEAGVSAGRSDNPAAGS